MNMSAFQDFMKVFSWVKSRSNLVEPLPLKSYLEKKRMYIHMKKKKKWKKLKLIVKQ